MDPDVFVGKRVLLKGDLYNLVVHCSWCSCRMICIYILKCQQESFFVNQDLCHFSVTVTSSRS